MPTRSTQVVLVSCLLALALGCSQPPTAEMQAAESALNAAREAGAGEYVPSLIDGAQAALEQAQEAVTAKQYDEARGFIAEATAEVEEAMKGLDDAKVAVRDQLSERIDALQLGVATARQELEDLDACPKAKRQRTDLDSSLVEDRLQQVEADLEGLGAALESGDFLSGLEDADAAGEELGRIHEEVTNASATADC